MLSPLNLSQNFNLMGIQMGLLSLETSKNPPKKHQRAQKEMIAKTERVKAKTEAEEAVTGENMMTALLDLQLSKEDCFVGTRPTQQRGIHS